MDVSEQLTSLPEMNKASLGALWQKHFGAPPPEQTRRDLIVRVLAYKIQEQAFGGLTSSIRRRMCQFASAMAKDPNSAISTTRVIKPGTRLIRQWQGKSYRVAVANSGFEYDRQWFASLSEIARLITGTRWSGPLFFGLKVSAVRQRRQRLVLAVGDRRLLRKIWRRVFLLGLDLCLGLDVHKRVGGLTVSAKCQQPELA
jgi:hypothetical protein